ncbi:MAG TPA: endonuclease/exonuclease/phosphatase family protein [Kofleriaceae bacterium]|nr:endonuclease/exonuclease/phosphatase family protein [Kofleriaceae bacterium]
MIGPHLAHDLGKHFDALRAIKTRKQLARSALWSQIGGEVDRLLDAIDVEDAPGARPLGRHVRAVAWNIQRGAHLDRLIAALRDHPELARADVLLLSEVDHGMGRSGNRHVARELAAALGMGYAFAVSYVALEDDFGENAGGVASTLALAGNAILSRAPIVRAINADVPAVRDKFGSSEKRLGRKRAAVAAIASEAGPITFAQAHLDSNADARQRCTQLAAILDEAERIAAGPSAAGPIVLGGDLNTTTYQYSSKRRLARDLLHKLFVTGFAGTIDNYLTPERRYETPIFDLLARRGFALDGFNERGGGTIRYDFNEPYAIQKVQKAVGGPLTRWLVRRLRRWNGVVAAHLDWFAGRGVTARGARVIRLASPAPSDHDPIVVDLELPAASPRSHGS